MSGHSAGAHLCAMVLQSSWFESLSKAEKLLFKGTFYLSGIFNLRPLVKTYVNNALQMNNEMAAINSPLLQMERLTKTIFVDDELKQNLFVHVVVGSDESPAFINQANDLFNKVIT